MSHFRGFIAIELDENPLIKEFKCSLKKTGADIKTVKPGNIHITLKFLGDTHEKLIDPIAQVIKKSTTGSEPFRINLKSAGYFPDGGNVKIVWIGLRDNGELVNIADGIDDGLAAAGFKRERRPFSPHITIARAKSGGNRNALLKVIDDYRDTLFDSVYVDRIKLIKSDLTPDGPVYTHIKEILL